MILTDVPFMAEPTWRVRLETGKQKGQMQDLPASWLEPPEGVSLEPTDAGRA